MPFNLSCLTRLWRLLAPVWYADNGSPPSASRDPVSWNGVDGGLGVVAIAGIRRSERFLGMIPSRARQGRGDDSQHWQEWWGRRCSRECRTGNMRPLERVPPSLIGRNGHRTHAERGNASGIWEQERRLGIDWR